MRKFAIAFAVAASLAGCTAAQVSTLDADTTNFIEGVQSVAASACEIIPDASSVVAVFNAAVGATIASVASAICRAAPAPASAAFKRLPRKTVVAGAPAPIGIVNGVQVLGWRAQ